MKKVLGFILSFALSVFAQTGGSYQIEKSVVASGAAAAGGNFLLDAALGQTLAGGFILAPPYSLYSGFQAPNLTPTAAQVSIGGRVATFDGRGIQNARLMLTDANGETRFAMTSTFGHYRFNDVRAGETYILTVFSKRFVFDNPTRIVNVSDEVGDIDFVAAKR